jgi:pimeloyl-ACP methyl ester carboxylesterase
MVTAISRRFGAKLAAAIVAVALLLSPGLGVAAQSANAAENEVSIVGTLPDGTGYGFVSSDEWNGTLIIDSDFVRTPGTLPEITGLNRWLLDAGYAIGGTSRVPTMDRVQESVAAMMGGLDLFEAEFGVPTTTIVKGGSLGGFTSRAAIQLHPDRLHGALAMCGGGAGVVGSWNQKLDAAFVADALIDPATDLPLVNITDAAAATSAWEDQVASASGTPEGRARLALAAAVGQIPTFGDAGLPQPGPGDFDLQLDHQISIFTLFIRPQIRATVEGASGGNISWNHDIDYAAQLQASGLIDLVEHHYQAAGVDLATDLAALADTERISADASAIAWAEDNISYSGDTGDRPVMTIHTSGDRSESLSFDQAYAAAFEAQGNEDLMRQAWVDRVGHCTFTDAERLAALLALVDRVETGSWGDTSATALNARAATLDADTPLELGGAGYFSPTTADFLRPWDGRHVGTYVAPAAPVDVPVTVSGVLHAGEPGQVVYEAIKPAQWNGTLILDLDFNSWPTSRRDFFLSEGYAIGGNQRTQNSTAYELKDYVDNLVETRRLLAEAIGVDGEPTRTIAWGNSRGGFVARMAAQYRPDIFDGAIGSAGGGSGVIASTLSKGDAVWALQQLVDPDAGLAVSDLPDDPSGVYSPAYGQDQALNALVADARSSDAGMARLVLAAAFSQMTDFPSGTVPPAADDFEAQGELIASGFAFGHPQFIQKHVEVMSGGPIYFNHGIDYADLLERSGAMERVAWWFDHAGLDLDAELALLAAAPRIGADPQAIAVAEGITTYSGTGSPVITLKTRGDPADPASLDEAYLRTFEASGNADELLRTLLIDGSGHGGQTFGEHLAAFRVLEERLDSGTWADVSPTAMNARVADLAVSSGLPAPVFGSSIGRYMSFDGLAPALRTWDFTNWDTYRPELSSTLVAGQTVAGTSDVVMTAIDANPVAYSAQLFRADGTAVTDVAARVATPSSGTLALEGVNWSALAAGDYELVFAAEYRNGLVVNLAVPLVRDAAGVAGVPGPGLQVTGADATGTLAAGLLLLAAGAALMIRRRLAAGR